jgi:hypothetical protein
MAAPAPQGGPPAQPPPKIDLTRKQKLKQGTLGFSTVSTDQYLQQLAAAAKASAEKAAADREAKAQTDQPVKRGPGRPKGSGKKYTVNLVSEGAGSSTGHSSAAPAAAAGAAGPTQPGTQAGSSKDSQPQKDSEHKQG